MSRSKKNKDLAGVSGWRITEAGRHAGPLEMRERRARRNQSWLWVLRLLIGVVVLVGAAPYLRDELLGSAVGHFLKAGPPSPVSPGDRNGLLH